MNVSTVLPPAQEAAGPAGIRNPHLDSWLSEFTTLLKPESVRWCDGSPEEYQRMLNLMVDSGTAVWLNATHRPNSIYVRSDPADVARVEDRTYICSRRKEDAGPTNHWADPAEMKNVLRGHFDGAMAGRKSVV